MIAPRPPSRSSSRPRTVAGSVRPLDGGGARADRGRAARVPQEPVRHLASVSGGSIGAPSCGAWRRPSSLASDDHAARSALDRSGPRSGFLAGFIGGLVVADVPQRSCRTSTRASRSGPRGTAGSAPGFGGCPGRGARRAAVGRVRDPRLPARRDAGRHGGAGAVHGGDGRRHGPALDRERCLRRREPVQGRRGHPEPDPPAEAEGGRARCRSGVPGHTGQREARAAPAAGHHRGRPERPVPRSSPRGRMPNGSGLLDGGMFESTGAETAPRSCAPSIAGASRRTPMASCSATCGRTVLTSSSRRRT